MLNYVRDALEARGYSTVSTVDRQGAPRQLRTRRPHLVLRDLLMPGIDGIELMEQGPGLGDLTVRYPERRVTVGDRGVAPAAMEFDLLRVLSVTAGRVSTYDSLPRQVWSGRDQADLRLLRTYVKRLRRKLGDNADSPANIVNERQVGYRMARPDDQ